MNTPNQNEQQQGQTTPKRTTPQNELDFQLMTINSQWGNKDISPGLIERLNKQFATQNEKGEPGITVKSLWDLLSFYTRDVRLGNLSNFNGEVEYVRYYLDLANDFLQAHMVEPFLISLSRAITILESSQSKGGFLRRRLNTFTSESFGGENEPPKKSLFGTSKSREV